MGICHFKPDIEQQKGREVWLHYKVKIKPEKGILLNRVNLVLEIFAFRDEY